MKIKLNKKFRERLKIIPGMMYPYGNVYGTVSNPVTPIIYASSHSNLTDTPTFDYPSIIMQINGIRTPINPFPLNSIRNTSPDRYNPFRDNMIALYPNDSISFQIIERNGTIRTINPNDNLFLVIEYGGELRRYTQVISLTSYIFQNTFCVPVALIGLYRTH